MMHQVTSGAGDGAGETKKEASTEKLKSETRLFCRRAFAMQGITIMNPDRTRLKKRTEENSDFSGSTSAEQHSPNSVNHNAGNRTRSSNKNNSKFGANRPNRPRNVPKSCKSESDTRTTRNSSTSNHRKANEILVSDVRETKENESPDTENQELRPTDLVELEISSPLLQPLEEDFETNKARNEDDEEYNSVAKSDGENIKLDVGELDLTLSPPRPPQPSVPHSGLVENGCLTKNNVNEAGTISPPKLSLESLGVTAGTRSPPKSGLKSLGVTLVNGNDLSISIPPPKVDSDLFISPPCERTPNCGGCFPISPPRPERQNSETYDFSPPTAIFANYAGSNLCDIIPPPVERQASLSYDPPCLLQQENTVICQQEDYPTKELVYPFFENKNECNSSKLINHSDLLNCSQFGTSSEGESCFQSVSQMLLQQPLSPKSSSGSSKSSDVMEGDLPENDGQNDYKTHIDAITRLIEDVKAKHGFQNQEAIDYYKVKLNSLFSRTKEGCSVDLYGSCRGHYAIDSSNINFQFFSVGTFTVKYIKKLSEVIERGYPNLYVSFEEGQKLKDSYITCIDDDKYTPCIIHYRYPESAEFRTSRFLECFFNMSERAQTLVVTFRQWTEACDIAGTETGRLHPICLALMVIHFLQWCDPPVLPIGTVEKKMDPYCSENVASVGELWLGLLEYYSYVFNWRDHVITVLSKEPILKESKPYDKCWVAVEAPFERDKNLAKSVTSQDVSQYIQMCFVQTYKYFTVPTRGLVDEENVHDSDSNIGENGGYNYTFESSNFTQGLSVPTSCPTCDEMGYLCDDCVEEDGQDRLDPLPNMTPTFLQSIDECLEETYNHYVLTEEEVKFRKKLVVNLEMYIKRKFKWATLTLIGSSTNGFGFKNSDLDICMTIGQTELEKQAKTQILRGLCAHLRKNKDFSHVFGLYSAKVPLVQFLHAKTKLRGDISLYNLLAVHNTKLLNTYSLIDNRAKKLGCAMKLLAKSAGIADTSQKSLSSYSYVLMVIHFLQSTSPPVLPILQELSQKEEKIVEGCNVAFFKDLEQLDRVWQRAECNTATPGELWLKLLKYYTEEFGHTDIISVRRRRIPIEQKKFRSARLFNIEDPFITEKNLGSVVSSSMSTNTFKTLLRARKLFGIPIDQVPSGFKSFQDYFFHPMNLTDGRVKKNITCDMCGKSGHSAEICKRFCTFPSSRGRPFRSRGGGGHQFMNRGSYNNNRGRYGFSNNVGRRGFTPKY